MTDEGMRLLPGCSGPSLHGDAHYFPQSGLSIASGLGVLVWSNMHVIV